MACYILNPQTVLLIVLGFTGVDARGLGPNQLIYVGAGVAVVILVLVAVVLYCVKRRRSVTNVHPSPYWRHRDMTGADVSRDQIILASINKKSVDDSDQELPQTIGLRENAGNRDWPVSVVQPFNHLTGQEIGGINLTNNCSPAPCFTKDDRCCRSYKVNGIDQAKKSALLAANAINPGATLPCVDPADHNPNYEYLEKDSSRRRFQPFRPIEPPGILKTVNAKYRSEKKAEVGLSPCRLPISTGKECASRKFVYDLAGPFREADLLRHCRVESNVKSFYQIIEMNEKKAKFPTPVEVPKTEQDDEEGMIFPEEQSVELGNVPTRTPSSTDADHVPTRIRLDYEEISVDEEESASCQDGLQGCSAGQAHANLVTKADSDNVIQLTSGHPGCILLGKNAEPTLLFNVGSTRKIPVAFPERDLTVTDPQSNQTNINFMYSNPKIAKSIPSGGKNVIIEVQTNKKSTPFEKSLDNSSIKQDRVHIVFEKDYAQKQMMAATGRIIYHKEGCDSKNKTHQYEEIPEQASEPSPNAGFVTEAISKETNRRVFRGIIPMTQDDPCSGVLVPGKSYDHIRTNANSFKPVSSCKTTTHVYDHCRELDNSKMATLTGDSGHMAKVTQLPVSKTVYEYATSVGRLPQKRTSGYDHILKKGVDGDMGVSVVLSNYGVLYKDGKPNTNLPYSDSLTE